MGITQVGSEEAEGFDEGLDLVYHDAAEDPTVLEPEEQLRKPVLSHGGCGSSSLRECIELMSNLEHKAPATCHSVAQNGESIRPATVLLLFCLDFACAYVVFPSKTSCFCRPCLLGGGFCHIL